MTDSRGIVLITGCSSGFGLEIAVHLAKHGYTVVATMRNLAKRGDLDSASQKARVSLDVLQLDVTDDASVRSAVRAVVSKHSRIDALINNAGYGVLGNIEETTLAEWKAQFETNVFGLVRVTQAVLPVMRSQRSGKIVHIGSIGGRLSAPYMGVYHSTKHALEAINEAMRHEIAMFDIQCTLIEPGGSPTKFVGAMALPKAMTDPASPYAAQNAHILALREKMRHFGFKPEEVARTVARALASRRMRRRYVVGADAKLYAFIRNFVPDGWWDPVVRKMYLG